MKSLFKHTDLDLFSNIYIVANDVSQDHLSVIKHFARNNDNIVICSVKPRGITAITFFQNSLYAKHPDSVFIKMDEDVFVTPGWLDGLLAAYNAHLQDDVVLFTPLVPNNQIGLEMLTPLLAAAYPDERESWKHQAVPDGLHYGEWIWNKVLRGRLLQLIKNKDHLADELEFTKYLNINCILFDQRLLNLALPFTSRDEANIYEAIKANACRALMTSDSLVHHYSFGPQQQHLDACNLLNDIKTMLAL